MLVYIVFYDHYIRIFFNFYCLIKNRFNVKFFLKFMLYFYFFFFSISIFAFIPHIHKSMQPFPICSIFPSLALLNTSLHLYSFSTTIASIWYSHLVPGLPLGLFPSPHNSSAFLGSLPSPILFKYPFHRNLLLSIYFFTFLTPTFL